MKTRSSRRLYLLALLLLGVSALSAFLWYFLLRPCVLVAQWPQRVADAPNQAWLDIQTRIRWIGWSHDDYVAVGMWGDKDWAERIIADLPEGKPIDDCAAGHKATALRTITNQDPGPAARDWKDWWSRNRDKSQAQWTRDGFAASGIELHPTLTSQDELALLRVLGAPKGNPLNVPHVRYNAYRWLRDNGFKPQQFTYADLPKDSPEVVFDGLRRFYAMRYPHIQEPGALYGRHAAPAPPAPWFADAWWLPLLAYWMIVVPLLGAAAAWWMARRRARRQAQMDAPPDDTDDDSLRTEP